MQHVDLRMPYTWPGLINAFYTQAFWNWHVNQFQAYRTLFFWKTSGSGISIIPFDYLEGEVDSASGAIILKGADRNYSNHR